MSKKYNNPVTEYLINYYEEHGLVQIKAAMKEFKKYLKTGGKEIPKRKAMKKDWVKYALDRQGGLCHRCGNELSLEEATGDHLDAHNRAGAHSKENIRAVHRSCNSKKSDGDLFQEAKKTGRTLVEILGYGENN